MDTIYTIYTILQYNCIILIYRKHRTKVHFLHFTVYRQHIQMCGKRVKQGRKGKRKDLVRNEQGLDFFCVFFRGNGLPRNIGVIPL